MCSRSSSPDLFLSFHGPLDVFVPFHVSPERDDGLDLAATDQAVEDVLRALVFVLYAVVLRDVFVSVLEVVEILRLSVSVVVESTSSLRSVVDDPDLDHAGTVDVLPHDCDLLVPECPSSTQKRVPICRLHFSNVSSTRRCCNRPVS